MPFPADAVRMDLACGIQPDGHWHGCYSAKVRANEPDRLSIRPVQGPGRKGCAEVSLIVSVFLRGESLGESVAAGPENWRTSVWGSPQVRALGAVYFPRLAEGDLRVKAEDLPAFLQECALLSEHLDAITGGVDLSAQKGIAVNTAAGTVTAIGSSHVVLREQVSLRLASIGEAARLALRVHGELTIW